jgi:transposase
MLDQGIRTAILKLHEAGNGTRAIARSLGISRGAIRDVIKDATVEVPRISRPTKAEPHRQDILELYTRCKGNLVRVHEELQASGVTLSYQALTAFCRRAGIGTEPKKPSGQYHFSPGQEMQHDTSPHKAKFGGVEKAVHTASVVMCYSRMLFFQHYPVWNRFQLKLFLTEAFDYFSGVAKQCMLDNSSVVVLHGTGKNMVPVPEMAAFSKRYGFEFKAHELGDANRSARVERPFDFIDNNFLAGREFLDFADMNAQARVWLERQNGTFKRRLQAVPRELFATEKAALVPLPAWLPDVYLLHQRIVDLEGYVSVSSHRYSAPWTLIGRRLEVREGKDKVELYDGPRLVATHARVLSTRHERVTEESHRPPRGTLRKQGPCPEERALLEQCPELSTYVEGLKKRAQGRGTLALRRLLRMLGDYPREPFLSAVKTANEFGMFDLERLERMALRAIAKDYFIMPRLDDPLESEDDDYE